MLRYACGRPALAVKSCVFLVFSLGSGNDHGKLLMTYAGTHAWGHIISNCVYQRPRDACRRCIGVVGARWWRMCARVCVCLYTRQGGCTTICAATEECGSARPNHNTHAPRRHIYNAHTHTRTHAPRLHIYNAHTHTRTHTRPLITLADRRGSTNGFIMSCGRRCPLRALRGMRVSRSKGLSCFMLRCLVRATRLFVCFEGDERPAMCCTC